MRQHIANVFGRPGAAGRYDRHRDCVGHGARELDVVAGARAVAIDAREEDLSRASVDALAGPRNRIETGWRRTGPREHRPPLTGSPGVDARHDALRAEAAAQVR